MKIKVMSNVYGGVGYILVLKGSSSATIYSNYRYIVQIVCKVSARRYGISCVRAHGETVVARSYDTSYSSAVIAII